MQSFNMVIGTGQGQGGSTDRYILGHYPFAKALQDSIIHNGIVRCIIDDTLSDMSQQWQTFHEYNDIHLKDIFGTPLLGIGSDGCTQRVPMQMRRMAINDSHGEYIGDYADGSANFTLTRSCIGLRAKLIEADNTVAGIHFQDYYHCVKKNLLSSDIVSRTLIFGEQHLMLSMVRGKVLSEHDGDMADWDFQKA